MFKRLFALCLQLFLAAGLCLGSTVPVFAADSVVVEPDDEDTQSVLQADDTDSAADASADTSTYTASDENMDAEADASSSALPDDAEFYLNVDDPESSEASAMKSVLGIDSQSEDVLIPFRMGFLKDSVETEPDGAVEVRLCVSKEAYGLEEIQSYVLYHFDDDSETSWHVIAPEEIFETDDELYLIYTLDSFSPFALRAISAANEAESEQVSSGTATDAYKAYISTKYSTPLYCYVVMPGYDGPTDYADPNVEWDGMGVGSINGDPSKYSYKESFSLDEFEWEAPLAYPDLVYKGHTLTYDGSSDPEPYTYSIEWSAIVAANGANEGHNSYNPEVDPGIHTFHLNGYVHLNIPKKCTVTFEIQEPAQEGFSTSAADSFEVDQGTPLSEIVPSVDDQKTYEGEIYVFEGWYSDSACSDKIDPDSITIEHNETYYGRYVPLGESMLTVTKNVENGDEEDLQTSFSFTITLSLEGMPYIGFFQILDSPEGMSTQLTDYNGTYTFTLQSGQDILFGLPAGVSWQVQETNIPEKFTTYVSLNDGTAVQTDTVSGQTDQDNSAAFTNCSPLVVPTGFHEDNRAVLYTALAIGMILVFAILYRRHRNHLGHRQ